LPGGYLARARLNRGTRSHVHRTPHPWHRTSIFGDGWRRRLDRNQRAKFGYLLKAHTTAGRVTAKGEWVGLALLKHLGADGRCDPSHATSAANARGIEPSTVNDALKAMRRCGLVTWQQRLVRAGQRVRQTSNAYALLPVAASVRCDLESSAQTSLVDLSTRLPSVPIDPNSSIERALRLLGASIEERLLTKDGGAAMA
jgi:DNA-binding MarR family transcriptional regulator